MAELRRTLATRFAAITNCAGAIVEIQSLSSSNSLCDVGKVLWEERAELQAMMQVFLEEKQWEGCGGLDLSDDGLLCRKGREVEGFLVEG